jgi:hypothetical protein
MCGAGSRTEIVLIEFLILKLKVFHKSKESANTKKDLLLLLAFGKLT